MKKFVLEVNGERREVEAPVEMPLLWVLRDELGLVGTKFGCGIGLCGACTVHVNDTPVRSCLLRASDLDGQEIKTIEGLATEDTLHILQQVWIEQDVAQCGYCQTGQMMSAAALLATNSKPTDSDIDVAMSGNYCRCGTYIRIRKAIHTVAGFYEASSNEKQGD